MEDRPPKELVIKLRQDLNMLLERLHRQTELELGVVCVDGDDGGKGEQTRWRATPLPSSSADTSPATDLGLHPWALEQLLCKLRAGEEKGRVGWGPDAGAMERSDESKQTSVPALQHTSDIVEAVVRCTRGQAAALCRLVQDDPSAPCYRLSVLSIEGVRNVAPGNLLEEDNDDNTR